MGRIWLVFAIGIASTAARSDTNLRVDPLLLKQIETVWPVIASVDNPLWPGWDVGDTPLMIYLPGEQELLINHPQPPAAFKQYEGPLALLGQEILYRDGSTTIEWDGQNTSREIYGVETLVLADTLSNRKMWLRGWLADPRSNEEKLTELPYDSLRADPYEQMAMIAHEAFHVFQMRNLPHKAADERLVRIYPCLAVENNVGFALEGEALSRCLRAVDAAVTRAAAVEWLAVRQHCRAQLPDAAIEYEDRNEFIEGTAKYIELALMDRLEGGTPDPALWYAQGFGGFVDLEWFRERRLESMLGNMRGEVNVNNDPYGTSPVRGRLYFSGMGIALLLDRLAPTWRARIAAPEATLTTLAGEAIGATEAELAAALQTVKARPTYDELRREKTQLAADGRRETQAMLEGIVAGPHTLLVIDYTALDTTRVGLSFTPFGVRGLVADRTIYTLVPIRAAVGSSAYGFDQTVPTPTFEDRAACQFKFQLTEVVSPAELRRRLERQGDAALEVSDLDLQLPGVKLHAARALITHEGRAITVQFLPTGDQVGCDASDVRARI